MSRPIEDPNMQGLPDDAFTEPAAGEGLSVDQLEARIRAKREQASQDAGWVESPHHADDIEPITPPAVEEPSEQDEEVEDAADTPEIESDEEADQSEEEEEGDEPAAEVDEDGEFFIGRYKTREEAERGIAEKDRLIAQQFRERHERETMQQQQTGTVPQIDENAWHQWAEEAVANGDGVQGAIAALERGGPAGYDVYISHWIQDEDPVARAEALAFNNEVNRQISEQRARSAQSQQQPNGAQPGADERVVAKNAVAQRYEDFSQLEPEMDRLISDDGPGAVLDDTTKQWLVEMSTQQGVDGKMRAWDYLYRTAAAVAAPRRVEAQQEEKKRRKVSGDAARLAATVSSSEGSSTRTPRSEAELAEIRKRNGIRERLGQPLIEE